MICASLALLQPLLSLTHWIFRSLMLPYKSSSHSANHVRCASLRSGRPPIGGQDRDGGSYRCSAPYTLSRFAGLRPGGKHVTGFSGRFALLQIQFLCHLKGKRGIWREKQASHILHIPFRHSPFGALRHHLPPAERWDYGCLAMEPCLCRKA